MQVDDESAVIVPRVFVVHALFDVNVNAADRVNDLLECLEIDDDIMIHVDAEEVFDRILCQFFAAVSESGIDLVKTVSFDAHACVTRDRKQGGLIFLRVKRRDHQRVTAADVIGAFVDTHDHDGRFVM